LTYSERSQKNPKDPERSQNIPKDPERSQKILKDLDIKTGINNEK